jgi:hypothetical protein
MWPAGSIFKGGMFMKRILLVLGIICLLSFSITGCDSCSKAPDKKAAVDTAKEMASDAAQAVKEKTGKVVEATKEGAAAAVDAGKDMASETAEAVKETTEDVVETTKKGMQ